MIPVFADDPLLRKFFLKYGIETSLIIATEYEFDDTWSDEEEDVQKQPAPADLEAAQRRIKALEKALEKSTQEFRDFHAFVGDRLASNIGASTAGNDEPLEADVKPRDDDTHYFSSYAENGETYLAELETSALILNL